MQQQTTQKIFDMKINQYRYYVYRGNIVPCNNTIMCKHNQICNIVQSLQFMPVESKKINESYIAATFP